VRPSGGPGDEASPPAQDRARPLATSSSLRPAPWRLGRSRGVAPAFKSCWPTTAAQSPLQSRQAGQHPLVEAACGPGLASRMRPPPMVPQRREGPAPRNGPAARPPSAPPGRLHRAVSPGESLSRPAALAVITSSVPTCRRRRLRAEFAAREQVELCVEAVGRGEGAGSSRRLARRRFPLHFRWFSPPLADPRLRGLLRCTGCRAPDW